MVECIIDEYIVFVYVCVSKVFKSGIKLMLEDKVNVIVKGWEEVLFVFIFNYEEIVL